jgi:hypothetical protein
MRTTSPAAIQAFFSMDRDMLKDNYNGHVITKAQGRWFWKTIDFIARVVSFGRIKDFMHRTTTVGGVIAFPEGMDFQYVSKWDYLVLRHEIKHVRQCSKLGLGEPWLGMFLFLFLYLFVPLPAWRSWFRFKFERDAFMEEYKYAKKFGWDHSPDHFIEALSGPQYLYAWPKEKVKAWFDNALAKN